MVKTQKKFNYLKLHFRINLIIFHNPDEKSESISADGKNSTNIHIDLLEKKRKPCRKKKIQKQKIYGKFSYITLKS